jgi:chromosome segregation protein
MYVKSLKLSGFKSFADPTILEFDPGVSVIVGPNGSGKSNVADALAWVLGSQTPSDLRSASMEDVIFAGAEGRTRLGSAEVEITLDNSSGFLPLDVSEVMVSRFTDRSGTSEYRINGTPCRLLDVTELLSDTGIGRSLHTVVGQGQLDEILQARAEERRAFIEEAAQIGKYRKRKDRALRKLERVDDNLMRLNDVLSELKRAVRPLKRQANAASAYSELMGEHETLRQRLAATELEILAGDEATLELNTHERRNELLRDELDSLRARLRTANDEREGLRAGADSAQQLAYRMGRAADRLLALGRLAEERAARIGARLAAETEESYRERIRLLETEQNRWTAEADTLTSSLEQASAVAASAQKVAESARRAGQEAESKLTEVRAEETSAAQTLVRAEGSESASRATVGSIEARVKAVAERREVAQRELADDVAVVERAEAESRALEQELDGATRAAAEAETTLEEAREAAERIKGILGDKHASEAAARARLQALLEAQGLLADLPDAAARLDPLAREAADSAAIASAAAAEQQGALSKAEGLIEERWQEVSRLDEELRRLDALMSGAVDRLSGARRRKEGREVERAALDEELARVRDSLAAAERAATEERAAIPAHRAALDQAQSRRQDAEQAVQQARRAVDDAAAKMSSAEIEMRAAHERSLAARLRVEEAEAGIADARRALEGLEDRRQALRTDMERVQALSSLAATAAHRGGRWADESEIAAERARSRAREAEGHLTSLNDRQRDLAERLEEASKLRNEAEVRRAEMRARAEAVSERALEEWGLTSDELRQLQTLGEEEIEEARERVEKLERDMKRLGPVNPNAAVEFREVEERQSFLEGQMEDLRSSKRDLLRVVHEVDDTIVEVFGKAFEDVATEFEATFARLFPGGSGRLKLTDPNDLLSSGVEVEARPPGKNVRKLSLLSGGERSLVALAFLFAIFRSRPSPFYLLDEVEAALDDVNLQRFLGLVEDLRRSAQVLVVTHQKRTMDSAGILYGVSMGKDGVSRVVAKRIDDVAGTGEPAPVHLP